MKDKILKLIEDYKNHLRTNGNKDEVYKWWAIMHFQNHWNFEVSDFYGMFKEALSKRENLMFLNSYGFLNKLGKKYPEKLKALFAKILNEKSSFQAIYNTSRKFADECLIDLKQVLNRDNIKHQLDERTISFLRVLNDPENEYLYKANVYYSLCDYLEIDKISIAGEKYDHFAKLGDSFIFYINDDRELLDLCQDYIPQGFKFDSTKLIFQDIVYNMLVSLPSSIDNKRFMTRLFNDIKEELESEEHPLMDHVWIDNDTESYRQVSVIPDTSKVATGDIHYELYRYNNKICFEVHPEGNLEFKRSIKTLINEFPNSQNGLKLSKWHTGIGDKEIDKGEHFKLVPKAKTSYNLKQENYEKVKHSLIAQFKSLYDDFNEPFLNFINMTNDNIKDVKFQFINWLIDKPKSNYFSNDKETLSRYLDNYNSYFDVDIFRVSQSNFKEIIKVIDKEAYQNTKSEFFLFSDGESNHRPRAILGKTNYFQFLEELFSSEETSVSQLKEKGSYLPNNQIFYGPPGTGKTYMLKRDLFPLYTTNETSITLDQHFESVVKECSWWEVIAIALLQSGKSKVNDIFNHKWVQKKAELSNSNTVKPTLWGQLQSHTIEECQYVNVKSKQQPLIFNKTEDSSWEILKDKVDNEVPELYELINKVENFNPSPDKEIKRYKFVTFHQSFSYEDFIEGIKPIMSDNTDMSEDLGYKIEDGIFKEICKDAVLDPNNRYAIFIDEINRGNVSAIFGELITLIEKDKRKGAINEMSIELPYSKKKFSVPSNIDIYGTMNTADRSVEALDTALRRRFEFVEKMPDYKVIDHEEVYGVKLSKVLKVINKRIELLIDRDHTIGHSYFVGVDTPEKLTDAFNNKIIPLLQEYFYGDYGKIGLVLGNGFVKEKDNRKLKFSTFKYEGKEEFITPTYKLIKVDESTVLNAVEQLLETNAS